MGCRLARSRRLMLRSLDWPRGLGAHPCREPTKSPVQIRPAPPHDSLSGPKPLTHARRLRLVTMQTTKPASHIPPGFRAVTPYFIVRSEEHTSELQSL